MVRGWLVLALEAWNFRFQVTPVIKSPFTS